MSLLTYLALGDSYTIGEQVPVFENFPYQSIQLLRSQHKELSFAAPEIVAKTGWTTDELSAGIAAATFLPEYDFVSLLIGVNNQYRGRSVANFKEEFEVLLQQAIRFAGNKHEHVFVISIPDWGVTPFAAERNVQQIAAEIDAYNSVCKDMAERYHCLYIDITSAQRMDGSKDDYLAADRLHPSGKEYTKWAKKLSAAIALQL
jgi:lysophospholipase L1-like esterase